MQRGKNGCAENIKRSSDSFIGSKTVISICKQRGGVWSVFSCLRWVMRAGLISNQWKRERVDAYWICAAHSWVCAHNNEYTFNSLLVLQLFPLWIGLRVGSGRVQLCNNHFCFSRGKVYLHSLRGRRHLDRNTEGVKGEPTIRLGGPEKRRKLSQRGPRRKKFSAFMAW